ncbi:MAG: MFS transporter [Symbiobacteriia bacterium]
MKGATMVKFSALMSVPFVMVLGNSMLIPVLPEMKAAMHLTQLQNSLIITAFSIPAGIAIAFAGFLSDRYSRKVVIAPSLIIYGLGGVIAGLGAVFLRESAYGIVLTGRVVQGIGAAGTAFVAVALAADIFTSNERTKALGLMEASNGLGKVLSPILGSLIGLLAWFAPFFFYAVLCVPSAAAIWFLVKEPKHQGEVPTAREYYRKVLEVFKRKTGSLLASFFAGTVVLFLLFGVLFYFTEILEKEYHIEGLRKGFIIAVPVLVMSITSYFTGKSLQHQQNLMKPVVWIGLAIEAAGLATPSLLKNNWVLFAAIAVMGLGSGLALPALNTLITSAARKQERGMVTSAYGSVRFFGVAAGPPIFGILMNSGRVTLLLVAAALAAAAAVVALIFIKPAQMNTQGGQGGTWKPPEEAKSPTDQNRELTPIR